MSYTYYQRNHKRRFYRSRSRSKLAGVCAGLADYFRWDLTIVRVVAIGLLIFFTAPTLVAYFLTVLLTDKI